MYTFAEIGAFMVEGAIGAVGAEILKEVFGLGKPENVRRTVESYAKVIIATIAAKIDQATLDLKITDAQTYIGIFSQGYNNWLNLTDAAKRAQIEDLENLIREQGVEAIQRIRQLNDIGFKTQVTFCSMYLGAQIDFIKVLDGDKKDAQKQYIMMNVDAFIRELDLVAQSIKNRVEASIYVKHWTYTLSYYPTDNYDVFDAMNQQVVAKFTAGGDSTNDPNRKAQAALAEVRAVQYEQKIMKELEVTEDWDLIKAGWLDLAAKAQSL